MPRNTREWSRRKLDEADINLNWAIYHIKEVADRYRQPHPEIGQPLDQSIEVIINLKTFLQRVKDSY